MHFLSVCAILRDEPEPYVREWVDYYTRLGVERFFLYDNGSRVPLIETLADRPNVTIHPIHGKIQQMAAYNDCLACHGKETHWLGFLDADEFVLPMQVDSLPALLAPYASAPGLAINWACFGNPDAIPLRVQSVPESFVKRVIREHGINRHVKTFCQPAHTLCMANPHFGVYRGGRLATNTAGRLVQESFAEVDWAMARVNHYIVRSVQDWAEKVQRGRADYVHGREPNEFDCLNRESIVHDTLIHRFLETRK